MQVDVFIFSIFKWKCLLPVSWKKKKVIFAIWNFAEKVIVVTTTRNYLENPWLWFLLGNNLSFKKKKFSVLVWRIVFSSIFRMAVSQHWGGDLASCLFYYFGLLHYFHKYCGCSVPSISVLWFIVVYVMRFPRNEYFELV